MKVILYMAMSLDGYIAKKDGDSSWISDVDISVFEEKVEKYGCIFLGRKTFEQYENEIYPIKGIKNIIITKNSGSYSV